MLKELKYFVTGRRSQSDIEKCKLFPDGLAQRLAGPNDIDQIFSLSRYTLAIKRTAKMFRHANGSPGRPGDRIARLFPP